MAQTYSVPGPSGLATTTDFRKNLAGLIVTNTSGVARSGIFPSHTNALVTSRSDLNVNIAAFAGCAVQFGGPILLANDGTVQLPSALVSPVSGTNYYVIYVKQNEQTSPGTDANDNRVFGAAVSTSSLTAARALMPTGALELATVELPTGKTATNQSGVVITQTHQYTAPQGGTVLLRNQTEQDAWSPANGSKAFRIDTGVSLVRRGGAWADTGWVGVTAADGTWNVSSQFGYRGVSVRQVANEVWVEGIFSRSTGFSSGFFMGSLPAGVTPPTQKTPLTCIANGTYIEMSLGDDAGANLNRFRMGASGSGNQTCIVTGHYFV